jgi:nicotinamide riboside kinase
MKKLVICGGISVGKTTVINCTKAVFDVLNPMDRTLMNPGPKVGFVPEAAWDIFALEPELDRTAYSTDLKIIQRVKQLEQLTSRQQGTEVLVCDRSVLDTIVFSLTHMGGHTDRLMKEFEDHIYGYSKFLLFDPENVPYVSTDIRIEGRDFRTELHKNFQILLTHYGVDWEIVKGPVSQRVLKVMDEILQLNR